MDRARGYPAPYFNAAGLLAAWKLLELGVEFVQHRLGVEALVLVVSLLDPFVDDRAGTLLRLGLHLSVGGHDVGAGRLERVQAHLVGFVPGLAIGAGGILARMLLDDGLVLL